MSPKSKKAPAGDPSAPLITAVAAPPRVSRHIQPLGPRVLVRVIRGPDRSESGLFLPAGAKDSHAEALLGEVIEAARTMPKTEIAPNHDDDDDDDRDERAADLGENVSGIPVGAQVLFPKDAGIAVPWDDSLRLLLVKDVLAIVQIIAQEEMQ